jgi:hypothetical protein
MTPFMFSNLWFVWPWQADAAAQDRRPDGPTGTSRSWRNFGRRRTREPVQDPAGGSEPSTDLAPWPGLRLLAPLTEDDLITFGRELEVAHDVVGRLRAEC